MGVVVARCYFVVKYRKGRENQVADHMCRLEEEFLLKVGYKNEINSVFSDEQVLAVSDHLSPWYVDFSNYLARDLVPSNLTFNQRKRCMPDIKKFFWDEPYFHTCVIGLFIIVCPRLRC